MLSLLAIQPTRLLVSNVHILQRPMPSRKVDIDLIDRLMNEWLRSSVENVSNQKKQPNAPLMLTLLRKKV